MDKITEKQNPKSNNLDNMTTFEILDLINQEDAIIHSEIKKSIPKIEKMIDEIVFNIKNGGRIIYVGCGTSGRIGVLDASECPPTFSVDKNLVQGVIAGGDSALRNAIENIEDSFLDGSKDIILKNVKNNDSVIGISANGSANYVHGALSEAKKNNALTVLITFNDYVKDDYLDHLIVTIVGPEIISGSTRMKAGTATKMILNMISTTVMIKLNKVFKNYMVDLNVSNQKLYSRAINIISNVTNLNSKKSKILLTNAKGNVKCAIVMNALNIDYEKSLKLIEESNGNIRKIIDIAD